MANSIGIDFGTTKTMVSYLNPATDRVELVRLGRDRDSIPTTVHLDESGAFLFGEDADDQIETDPEGYCRAFKLHLGEKDPPLPRSDETAESLAARFLRYIKSECEQSVFHGESITAATITVPVSFAPARKAALKRAAEAAGFSSVSFIPEPEAAGTAFLRDNPADKFSRALVLDWGGGTLDIAIISRDEDGTIHADRHCAEGRDDVGGEEMDRGLFENLKYIWEQTLGAQLFSSEENEPKLLRESEKVKIGLSRKDTVPFRQGKNKIDVTRDQFRQIVEQLLQASVDLVNSALSKNKAQGHSEPDAILLIGGTCQSPVVRETMEKNFPRLRVLSWHHSHEAVALGAMAKENGSRKPDSGRSGQASNSSRKELLTVPTGETEKTIADVTRMAIEEDDLTHVGKKRADIIAREANRGNPRAAALLGHIYLDGCNGYETDFNLCLYWSTVAAEAGDDMGQALLAMLYIGGFEGGPVRKNRPTALKWAEKAVAANPSLSNRSILVAVLSSFDKPDTDRIKQLGSSILDEARGKSPEQFTASDRAGVGGACFFLAMIANAEGDENKRDVLLRTGAEFGNQGCSDILSGDLSQQNEGSFRVTDEAIRLFAKLAAIDDRRNQTERDFMEEWCPGVCSSDPWTRPLRVSETIETLAAATAESYGNDQDQLGQLLSVLRNFAACDGPVDDEEKAALQWISYMFGQRSTKPRSTDSVPAIRIRDPDDVPNNSDESWGAGTGAAAGAVIGSIIPGIGTLAGAGIGAAIGGIKKWLSNN